MKTAAFAAQVDTSKPVGWVRWSVLTLLFGATTINYMDRFLLGVLKPAIVGEWHWTETNYANVVFCFQLAYAVGLLTVSRLVDAVGVRFGMVIVSLLCMTASASHSLATTVGAFCVARFALGIAEAGTWPGCMKTIGEWFPRRERSLCAGVVNAGSSVGATITPLVVPVILTVVAWQRAFLFTASLDVLWLIVWITVYREPDLSRWLGKNERDYILADLAPPAGHVPWHRLFAHRQTWAFLIAKGLSDPVWWFYLFWVPGFLAGKYYPGATSAAAVAKAISLPVTVIYIMADGGSVLGGWLSMRLIARGWSLNAARKTVMLGCAVCVSPVFLVAMPIGLWPSVLLIGLAAAAHLGFSANLFTVATDTVPKRAVSSVAGIGGMAAAVGGMFVAKAVGLVLDHTHSYVIPFAAAACAYWVALGILHLLLPRLEPMEFTDRAFTARGFPI